MLLVRRQRENPSDMKKYYIAILILPLILVTVLAFVSWEFDAVEIRPVNCDIANPAWVRLVGFAGANLVLTIPGVFLSGTHSFTVFFLPSCFRNFQKISIFTKDISN